MARPGFEAVTDYDVRNHGGEVKCQFTWTNQPCDELPADAFECTNLATNVGVMEFADEEGSYREKVFTCEAHGATPLTPTGAAKVITPWVAMEFWVYRIKGNWDVYSVLNGVRTYLRTEWSG